MTDKYYEKFKRNVAKKHGSKFTLVHDTFVSMSKEMTFICPIHGPFRKTPLKFLHTIHGCTLCSIATGNAKQTKGIPEAILNSSYLVVEYNGRGQAVIMMCPTHGLFKTYCHTLAEDKILCPKCRKEQAPLASFNTYVAKSITKFNSKFKYTYDGDGYAVVECPTHGKSRQKMSRHYASKYGCYQCAKQAMRLKISLTMAEAIIRANKMHSNKYGYKKDQKLDKGVHTRIWIKCPVHGWFKQLLNDHLAGRGCPKCSHTGPSLGENEINEFIKSLGFITSQSDRKALGGKEIDIFVETKNIGIEYNGMYYHSEKFRSGRRYHYDKTRLANEKGIDLIHVREDQWKEKKAIVKSIIANRLGISENKTWARKCVKRDLTKEEFKKFTEENHLQGYAYADTKIGLFFKGELVAAIGVLKGDLNRYVIKLGWKVGAALKRLIKGAGVTHTFCDLTTFNGSSYKECGLVADCSKYSDGIMPPSFVWTNGNICRHRRFGQKRAQEKRYGSLDWSKTEAQSMAEHGWYRLWDCGKIKFVI